MLHLPTRIPHWADLRRLMLGWVTIETPGYIASAKVHYKASRFGISGTRVHTLFVWAYAGQSALLPQDALYRWDAGRVTDRGDADVKEVINLILEYFR